MEGGGPYAYPDPKSPRDVTGFEVELMTLLAQELGVTPEFSQGQWDKLLKLLDLGRIDMVVNGYEWTPQAGTRLPGDAAVLRLPVAVDGRAGSPIRSWADLKQPRPGGGRWTVGVLVGSAADTFAAPDGGEHVQVVRFDGATDAMTAVQNGQYDATLQDLPAARFYIDRYPRPRARRAAGVARLLRDLHAGRRSRLARRTRPGTGPADRQWRAAPALRKIRHLDRGPARARKA